MMWMGWRTSLFALTGLIELARVIATAIAKANVTTMMEWDRFNAVFLLRVLAERVMPQKTLRH
jgi:hypothetical protein